jgi:hypothetical protein
MGQTPVEVWFRNSIKYPGEGLQTAVLIEYQYWAVPAVPGSITEY